MTANLVEVFSSVQGEGGSVGATTLFVRFGECDLRCRWCDSPHTWTPAAECRIEQERASGSFRSVANPLSLDAVVAAAEALDVAAHRFVSLTGGEPLLQPEAVRAIAEALRDRGPRILLETHGLATGALRQVAGAIDLVSMDWKLASDVRRAGAGRGPAEPFHAEHERFLRAARESCEVVVKVVVTPATRDAELEELAKRIAEVDPKTPVVVQPVTPFGPVKQMPDPRRLLGITIRLAETLADVRMIPQTHPRLGVP